jgi:Rod binding domain-containing protein
MESFNPAFLLSSTTDPSAFASSVGPSRQNEGPPAASGSGQVPNFEALLMSMLVKEMRQSMGSELFPDDQSDILGSMFDQHMGDHMAEFARLGMNEAILGHLKASSEASLPATMQGTIQGSIPGTTSGTGVPSPTGPGSERVVNAVTSTQES